LSGGRERPRAAMILAAGRGERMRPLTDSTPKPLLEVAGKPLLEYHLENLAAAGVRQVVVNVSWLGAQIVAALGDGSRWGLKLRISDEGSQPLETGGGIFNALPLLGPDPFVVVSADIWSDYPLSRLLTGIDLRTGAIRGHLVMVPNPPFHPRGDFGLEGDRLTQSASGRFTFGNIAVYRPDFFAGCEPGKFPLLPLFQRAIRAGTLSGELYTGRWHNLGTTSQLSQLNAELMRSPP
jgi:MurNAc alpha-1-phosphate uridylyltransferase